MNSNISPSLRKTQKYQSKKSQYCSVSGTVPTLQETGLGQAGSDSSLWTTHWLRTLGLRELAVVRTFQKSSHFFYFTWQPVWIWIIAFTYWTPPCHCPSTAPRAGMEKNKFYGNAFNKEKKNSHNSIH